MHRKGANANWKLTTIGEACTIVNGGTPKSGNPEYWNGNNLWITPAEMGKLKSPYVGDTERKITEQGVANSSARTLPPYSIILSSRAPIGYLVINTKPMATNQGCKGLIPHQSLNYKYLYHYLTSIVDQLEALGTGTTFKELSGSRLKEVSIQIPLLDEQKQIAKILDEAFEAMATAKANAEKNIQNARVLFESHLSAIFSKASNLFGSVSLSELALDISDGDHMPPPKSVSGIPFVTIGNINKATMEIDFSDTFLVSKKYYESLKPIKKPRKGDVLYTVTGSYGIPVKVDSQVDFCFQRHIGIIRPKSEVNSSWLFYLLLSPQVFEQADDGATGTAQKTISLKVLRDIKVPKADLKFQESSVFLIDALNQETQALESIYQRKLSALDTLKKSLLHQAFSGQLTSSLPQNIIPFPTKVPDIAPTDLHAGILAIAYQSHEFKGNLENYGHVKAEKIAHMVEAHLGIDLDRSPIKDAAGPNDYPHSRKVEHRARMAGFFDFHPTETGAYQVKKLPSFDKLILRTREKLGDRVQGVIDLMNLMVGMTTRQAEIFATVYAAWNNLLLDGKPAADEDIVTEARENWHPAKMDIPREKFFKAIGWIREQKFFKAIGWIRERNLMPKGMGKRVLAKA